MPLRLNRAEGRGSKGSATNLKGGGQCIKSWGGGNTKKILTFEKNEVCMTPPLPEFYGGAALVEGWEAILVFSSEMKWSINLYYYYC